MSSLALADQRQDIRAQVCISKEVEPEQVCDVWVVGQFSELCARLDADERQEVAVRLVVGQVDRCEFVTLGDVDRDVVNVWCNGFAANEVRSSAELQRGWVGGVTADVATVGFIKSCALCRQPKWGGHGHGREEKESYESPTHPARPAR